MRSLSITIAAFIHASAALSALSGAELVISEFMASNDVTLDDEDGDSSDWVEIYNAGLAVADLEGWYLTDDPELLVKWRFPAVSIEAKGFLLVFASGKNRANPAREIHTNFQIDSNGEFLALVEPDGVTIAHAYTQAPEQLTDFSYGIGQRVDVESLVPPRASARVLVPLDASLGASWTGGDEPFDDGAWIAGELGVGYQTTVPGFAVTNHLANVSVSDLATAERVLEEASLRFATYSENAPVVDYLGTGGGGHYPDSRTFPGAQPGQDVDDFVIEATAIVTIPAPGAWTFGVLSDDGFGLSIEGFGTRFDLSYPAPRGPADTLGVFDVPDAGDYVLRLVMYERGGGSSVELFAARGSFASWSTGFRLVGDIAGGGLAARSEVASQELVAGFSNAIKTDLHDAMFDVGSSVYVRVPFDVADPAAFSSLSLRMKYDDGFVAYLNGDEIARRNAPASPRFDSTATDDRPASTSAVLVDIGVSENLSRLRAGANVLAIHALNSSIDADEFLVSAELAQVEVISGVPVYFDEPSPAEANTGGFVEIVADTKFSVDRGFFEEPFEVEITTATDGAEIHYTVDGTPPTATRGDLYEGPLLIDHTTTLRAAAFKDRGVPTNVDTQTYIFLDDVVRQDYQATVDAGFPPLWGGTQADYGLDPDVVGQDGQDLYGGAYATSIRDDLKAVPTMSIVLPTEDLFGPGGIYTNSGGRGVGWERSASLELIHPDGSTGFQVNCGLRIQGGAFRNHNLTKKHSFRFLFKREYGPTKLRYPLFGPDAVDEFDTITARANANDSWRGGNRNALYIIDSYGRTTMLDMGLRGSRETWVHLYLNGFYWGLYNPVERPDASFSATYFGGPAEGEGDSTDKDDWDAIARGNSVSNGTITAWNTLFDLANQGLGSDVAYQRLQGRNADGSENPALESYLDVPRYIDYMITNIAMGNGDWPHNNWWATRSTIDSTGFKFHMWDCETSLGGVGTNRVDVNNGVAVPYNALRAHPEFRVLFGDHLQRHISPGGALYVDSSQPDYDPDQPERNRPAARFARIAARVERALVGESARWGDQFDTTTPTTVNEHWVPQRDGILDNYMPRRTDVVVEQFRAAGLYPGVGAPIFSRHGGDVPPGFTLFVLASAGVTYYTLDGPDPRAPGGELSAGAIEAGSATGASPVVAGARCAVLVPPDGSLGLDWTSPEFDDSTWIQGATGVGYEASSGYEALIATDVLDSMRGITGSVFVRVPFEIDGDPGSITFLTLRMKYDDGFVAYINGERVASRNAPTALAWNSTADSNASDNEAVIFENIDVSSFRDALRDGSNVLAIHGLNVSTGSSDMLILPELAVTSVTGDGVPIDATATVRARALLDGEWSALNEATFVVAGPSGLRVSEIMYHPRPSTALEFTTSDYEYIELVNTGEWTIDLTGTRLEGGIEFDFTNATVTSVAPGRHVVVARSLEGFLDRYEDNPAAAPSAVAGEYEGRLENGGEAIRIVGPRGETVLDFTYDDAWYPLTDGSGHSLVIADEYNAEKASWSDAAAWRPSFLVDGSPGTPDEDDGIPRGWQRPGDANQDGQADLSDAVRILIHLFVDPIESAELPCSDGGSVEDGNNAIVFDVNGDARVDLSDPLALLAFLFSADDPPAAGTDCVRLTNCAEACAP